MAPRRYPLSMRIWPGTEAVQIYDINNRRLCSIPLESLKASGQLNWSYVFHCIEACVESPGKLLREGEDTELDVGSPVIAGKYYFLKRGAVRIK